MRPGDAEGTKSCQWASDQKGEGVQDARFSHGRKSHIHTSRTEALTDECNSGQ
jgi:hypothetical protein